MKNDYGALAVEYQSTHQKPDKQYSILPTVLELAGELEGKTLLDLGCGDGFFARELAHAGAKKVFGMDNSEKQIALANERPTDGVDYAVADIFTAQLPPNDITICPFVANYAESAQTLTEFFERIRGALTENGKLVLVVDLPTGANLEKFGAVKIVEHPGEDGSPMRIRLYDKGDLIVELNAFYYSKETVERALTRSGFHDIAWRAPIISKEGIGKLGQEFWAGYVNNPELGYLTARK